jgi:hypothetical protein
MNDSIHDSSANERHERNKRALAYLDALKHRDAELELERKEQLQARGLGCVCILILNAAIWYSIWTVCKTLGEL